MDWSQILEGARRGDVAAREALVARFHARVRTIVHRELARDLRPRRPWIWPLFSTGDIVQEVFVSAVDSLDRFAGGSEPAFVRYLATIVKNRIVDAVRFHEAHCRDARRSRAGPESLAASNETAPSLAAALAEQFRLLREATYELPVRERELIELRIEREWSFPRIAARLDFPTEDAARKAFRAAKARLLVKLRARGLRVGEIE